MFFDKLELFLSSQHILIVQRQLSVLEEELEEFRLALRQYMECACAQTGCLQSVHFVFCDDIFILSFHVYLGRRWKKGSSKRKSQNKITGNRLHDFTNVLSVLHVLLPLLLLSEVSHLYVCGFGGRLYSCSLFKQLTVN